MCASVNVCACALANKFKYIGMLKHSNKPLVIPNNSASKHIFCMHFVYVFSKKNHIYPLRNKSARSQ